MGAGYRRLAVAFFVAAFVFIQASAAHAVNKVGTTGDDNLFGTNRPDKIVAQSGNDTIFGKKGDDRLYGGPSTGGDIIVLGAGVDLATTGANGGGIIDDDGVSRDKMVGNDGGDFIIAADGARDTIRCGGANDIVIGDAHDRIGLDCEIPITFSYSQPNEGVIMGTNNSESITAPNLGETILSKRGNDTLSGTNGGNGYIPGHGRDTVNAGTGPDVIHDGDGLPDVLNAGAGDDRIYAADGAIDTINCGGQAGDILFADANDILVLGTCIGTVTTG